MNITEKLTLWAIFFLAALVAGEKICAQTTNETDVFEQLITNIQQLEINEANIRSVDANTTNYLATVSDQGAFPDINYASTSQTNWVPITHLDRLKSMALSYIIEESSYYQNEDLYNTIVKMLEYWYKANPTSTNWFNWEIGWPQRMGLNLVLLRKGKNQVPVTLESNILNRMKSLSKGPNQAGSQGTGANKMDIAVQWIYRCTLQKNKTDLDFAVNQLYLPLTFNTGEGLQSDYSYLQHGMQLYTGGYGNSVLTVMTKAAFYFEGTEYETSGQRLELISEFIKRAYIPAIRGKYMLYNAVGRGFARKNGISSTGFVSILERMIELDPANSADYANAIRRIQGAETPNYELSDSHSHFWRGDYTLHQREGYTVDVRMASTFTCRNENGNGENLKGYFLTDGASQIVIDGDEFVNIFPTWDWSKIPGITAPALTTIPQPAQWERKGISPFAGGVSDGEYGVTTYYLRDYDYNINTEAKKSYFFFDDEIVFLGAGIQSTNAAQIHTTVNQCLLSGDVTVLQQDGTAETLDKGLHTYDGTLSWLQHDKIAYYFPDGGNLSVRNDEQTGTWNSISNNSGDASTQQKDVLKIWFNHGQRPAGENYSYVIVPNTNSIEEAQNRDLSDIEIIENTNTIQAVRHRGLDMLGIVFYEPGLFESGDLSIRSRQACTVMLRNISSDKVDVYVADPTRILDQITLQIQHPALGWKELVSTLDHSTHYGGSTHQLTLDENTPDLVLATGISLDKQELTLGLTDLFGRLTATLVPANAGGQAIIWSSDNEEVARVNEEGGVVAYGKGEATITATIEGSQLSAACKIWVEDRFYSALALADAYVYDGNATANFGNTTTVTVRTDGGGYVRRGYYKFPLADLDQMDPAEETAKVKIALYVEDGADNVEEVSWRLYPVTSLTWGENTITWNNKPPVNTSNLLGEVKCIKPANTDFNPDYMVEFDITDYALSQYNNGKAEISLNMIQNIRATAGKGTSNFASKEHPNILKHPRIMTEVSELTGMDKIDLSKLSVYPTITSDYVWIGFNKILPIQLINSSGMLLQTFLPDTSGEYRIDLTPYPDGLYLIKIENITRKVVKQ